MTAIRTLQCIVPHSGEEGQFINETEVSPISTPVSHVGFVDDEAVSIGGDSSCTLPETGTTGTPHLVRLIATGPEVTSSTQQFIEVDLNSNMFSLSKMSDFGSPRTFA